MNGPLRVLKSPLTASPLHLDQPAMVGAGDQWTWRQVHAAAHALAARLNSTNTVCNLCDSRVGFLVAWLAALRKGCLQMLPPSSGRADLSAMLGMSVDPIVVVDDPRSFRPEWRDHAQCLVWAPARESASVHDAQLAWSPDWDSERVRMYTSGSTGAPEPHLKTLAQLARGAQLLGARLGAELNGELGALGPIVCSVPPQHMFGLEASVMLPLIHGMTVVERLPLLPADVRTAFEEFDDGATWVTTPLHLRSLQRAGERLPHCRAVVVSTMPLAADLAADAERLVSAPVLEIYGSTETGAIATRRTAREVRWKPLPDVGLAPGEDGCQAWGSHFTSPQRLADHVAIDTDGTFALLGRQADLIKVAGRRASLAGLNQLLQQLPGLSDGVFYLPTTDSPTERLVLIHVGQSTDRSVMEAWLRERMDPVFVPRVFIAVDRLPRSPSGKLPRAALTEIYEAWRAKGHGDRTP